MDDQRLGTTIRALRIRRGWRHQDLADRAGTSRWTIGRIERGRLGSVRVETLRLVADALDATVALQVRWRGGDLQRLVNARHSAFHEVVARRFADLPDWLVAPEASFSVYGERGFVDVLAFHGSSGTVLIVELKTDIVDVQEMLGSLDRKRRLAPQLARDRGWQPARVGVWLAIAEGRTNRRAIAAHRTVVAAALPDPARRVGPWLRDPSGRPLAGVSFVTDEHRSRRRSDLATPRRVRPRRRPREPEHGA